MGLTLTIRCLRKIVTIGNLLEVSLLGINYAIRRIFELGVHNLVYGSSVNNN